MAKYPKQATLAKYYDDAVLDSVHNMLKHGMEDLGKYQVYLRPVRNKNNGHRSGVYRLP